jgi:sulfite reductase alpha subunit-like flavoprotein
MTPQAVASWPCGQSSAPYQAFPARLVRNDRLTASAHPQDVRHIVLDITDSGFAHEPGDVLSIHPDNPAADTDAFITTLGLHPRDVLQIAPTDVAAFVSPIPSPITVHDLFHSYLDIFGTPRRFFFEVMMHFAATDRQREKLRELSSPDGQDDLYRYCLREKRSYVDVLRDFPGVTVPLPYLLDLIPRINARQFSICSALRAHPAQVQVCVAVVAYTTPMRRHRTGLCSTYLAGSTPNDIVRVTVRPGSIRGPPASVPLVLIGPGTGIAPLRAMVEDRAVLRTQGGTAMDFILSFAILISLYFHSSFS